MGRRRLRYGFGGDKSDQGFITIISRGVGTRDCCVSVVFQRAGEKRKKGWIIFKARGFLLHLGCRRSDFTGHARPCDDKAAACESSFHASSRLILAPRGRTDPTVLYIRSDSPHGSVDQTIRLPPDLLNRRKFSDQNAESRPMGDAPTTMGIVTALRARVTRQALPHSALSTLEAEVVLMGRRARKGIAYSPWRRGSRSHVGPSSLYVPPKSELIN